jgi:DNA-binding MarR family transcriptional regulator
VNPAHIAVVITLRRIGQVTKRCTNPPLSRPELEKVMSADMRAITAQSDRIGRYFARRNGVTGSDFHALLHIMVAESAGKPLTLAQLRERMDVSPAAITYLVDRMIDAGHIRREADPGDRRKSLLRYELTGMALAHDFFGPLGVHLRRTLASVDDRDLVAAHRVFMAMVSAMADFESELVHHRTAPTGDQPSAATDRRRKVDH